MLTSQKAPCPFAMYFHSKIQYKHKCIEDLGISDGETGEDKNWKYEIWLLWFDKGC